MTAMVSAHGGGGFGGGGNRNYDYSCVCGTQCTGNTGTKNFSCLKTRTQYRQCAEEVCSNKSCAAGQLFNPTTLLCEACPTGQHVDASMRRCVCNQGTTWNLKTRSCSGTCPSGSTVTADRCDCVYPAVENKVKNACEACPSGTTTRGRKGCTCTTPKLFWNAATFSCQPCPGSWVTVSKADRRGRVYTLEVCQCPTATDAFNKRTVACVTCPTGSTASTNDEGCRVCTCTSATQIYDEENNVCADRATFVRDSSSHP